MRQRRLKNLDKKYEAYEDLLIYEPAQMKGRWRELSKDAPLFIEIGCGKGRFISGLAEREPEHHFIAVEGNMSVMLRAMEKIREKGLANVTFVPTHAGDLTDWFSDGEAAGIYLNFSDPLPKNYWYKRRLTYRDRLKSYFRVLKEDGTVTFKTDNTDLFEWSVLEIAAADLRVLELTRDLHADPELSKDNIETEYEARYSALGEKIKRERSAAGKRPQRRINKRMDKVVFCEVMMLIIFGCSWPANIYKSVTSRTTLGKSLLFEVLIVIGYLFGLASKVIIYNRTGELHLSFWFYILDISMVLTDICLYFRNLKIDRAEGRI